MRSKTLPSEYLAFLSIKYEVDVDKFFKALISARDNRQSRCGNLSIQCRDKQNNNIILLITKGPKVVAQFPIPEGLLLQQYNPIKNARKAIALGRHATKKDTQPKPLQIKNLRIGMKKVNLKAEVLEITKPTLVVTRYGKRVSVANALISDETGKIKLCLWNDQTRSMSVGDTVQIENARISTFRGEKQLRVGKNGNLHVARNTTTNSNPTPHS
jgi:replication factor A1